MPSSTIALLDRNEDRMADLVLGVIGEVALAAGILDEDHVAGGDETAFAVACGDLHPGIEVDDVLPARRPVPRAIVLGLRLAKDHSGRRQLPRQFAAAPLLGPLDLDVAEMRLATGIGVEIVDP